MMLWEASVSEQRWWERWAGAIGCLGVILSTVVVLAAIALAVAAVRGW